MPVNRTRIVEEPDGSRYVEREYAWPYGEPDDLDRPEKEAWLAALVRGRGIPAPRELSRTTEGGRVVVRREYLPGRPLGDVPVSCAPAWRAAGAMLARVHAIRLGDRAGVIAGREVRPFPEGSWGRWQLANAVRHAPAAHRDRVRRLFARAVPLLDARPVRLLHNDPHPWNVLVQDGRCTGLLDWEFAWTGDPAWDVARLDLFRLADIGPTPPAFAAGYGAPRVPLVSDLYELAILMWMSGEPAIRPTYERATAYVAGLDGELARLERLG